MILRTAFLVVLVGGLVFYGVCLLFGKAAWMLYSGRYMNMYFTRPASGRRTVQPHYRKAAADYARKTRAGFFMIGLSLGVLLIHLPLYFGAGIARMLSYAGYLLGAVCFILLLVNAARGAGILIKHTDLFRR
ncbi:MAG: hypothetical protein LBT26_09490 [Clostridiales Family XIII bacterium]|jgi:hypothetical protein|nr:hypothetical protein [Clostridiales Family XIII bacterium]